MEIIMIRPAFILILGICTVVIRSSEAAAQCSDTEESKLTASDGAAWDQFGTSVSVDGTVAIAGANGDDSVTGSAYVYRFNGSQWVEEQKLTASDGVSLDWFGNAVAVSGAVAVVGAPQRTQGAGAAYVYRYDGSQWQEEQKLTASDGVMFDTFGWSVAVEGTVAVVGAFGDDSVTGSAYVYRFDGSTWQEEQKLTASDRTGGDQFGVSVSLGGAVALVGANGDDTMRGAAYAYRFDGSQWVEEQKLTASDRAAEDSLGLSVSVDGSVAVAGAVNDDDRGKDSGSCYVFRFDGSQWVEEQKLTAADGTDFDWFGYAVSVRESKAVVGAVNDDDPAFASGSAYRFQFDGIRWLKVEKLTATSRQSGDMSGWAVAMDEDTVLVSATGDDDLGSGSGSVHVFSNTDLALETNQGSVQAGDTLSLTTCGGLNGGVVLLAVVDVSSTPTFWRIGLGSFDATGQWRSSGTVPSGLSGLVADFQSFGFHAPSRLGVSDRETVTFQ